MYLQIPTGLVALCQSKRRLYVIHFYAVLIFFSVALDGDFVVTAFPVQVGKKRKGNRLLVQ